jgi:hypothetical protein
MRSQKLLIVSAAVLACTSLAPAASFADDTPVPAGSLSPPPSGESAVVYGKQTPNKAILITGLSLLASTYVTTAAFADANGPIADRDLLIPIFGPWVNLKDRTPSARVNNERDAFLIAGSGVLQGMSTLMVVASFFIPEKLPAARIQAGDVNMVVSPHASAGGGGLGAIGTF